MGLAVTADWLRDYSREDFLALLDDLTPDQVSTALWARCRFDLTLFCAAFLRARFTDPFSRMHRDFLDRDKVPWQERSTKTKRADAAPRENAKSTIESWASVVHDVVYGLEAYVCLLSTTFDLSEDLAADLHDVFTDASQYTALHELYGPFTVAGGKTDFVVRVPGGPSHGCRVKAFSFGGSIRGTKHAGIRPTKVIIDDGEHPEKVRSPAVREKTWAFLTKDVLKAGSKGTSFRVVGTVLHPDSMLERLLTTSPGWEATRWRSIEAWPERTDLWDRCRRLWADLSDPDRQSTARSYYDRHRAEMDRGAVVLWPEHEPLYDLMIMFWEDEAAFSFEKQNEPLDPNRTIFFPEKWPRCQVRGREVVTSTGRVVSLRECDVATWLDPRASKQIDRNDYAACVTVARERKTGQIFVLSCLLERVDTERQIAWMWPIYDQYPQGRYGYEDNGFAVLMGDVLDQQRATRRADRKPDQLPLTGHTSSESKMDRIISLQPRFNLGWIEVADTVPGLLIEQFRQVPTGTHDDGPDAVERAIWLLDGPGTATAEIGVGWGE